MSPAVQSLQTHKTYRQTQGRNVSHCAVMTGVDFGSQTSKYHRRTKLPLLQAMYRLICLLTFSEMWVR